MTITREMIHEIKELLLKDKEYIESILLLSADEHPDNFIWYLPEHISRLHDISRSTESIARLLAEERKSMRATGEDL